MSKNKGPRKPSDDEKKLWVHNTRDVSPIHHDDGLFHDMIEDEDHAPQDEPIKRLRKEHIIESQRARHHPLPVQETAKGKEIDGRTFSKLKKGQIRPQARIDLHGLTQAQAHDALRRFIISSIKADLRCVLVITGKGKVALDGDYQSQPGIIRRSLPDWLSTDIYADHVLQWMPAQPKDGGGGAYYVYLRKNR